MITLEKNRCPGYVPDQTRDEPYCALCGEHVSAHRPSKGQPRRTAMIPQYRVIEGRTED